MKNFLFLSLILLVISEGTGDDENSGLDEGSEIDYKAQCEEEENSANEGKCLGQNLNTNSLYCCMVSYVSDQEKTPKNVCTLTNKIFLSIFNNAKLKALYREYESYLNIKDGDNSNNELDYSLVSDYKCKDGNFTMENNLFKLTEEEKGIINSENHCFYLNDDYIKNKKSASNEICQNRTLTQKAKDEGLKCGFFDITFKSKSGETKNVKTCHIVNTDDTKSGKLNSYTKNLLNNSFGLFDKEEEVTYTFNLIVGKEISASYDSGTDKIVNNSNIYNNDGNNGDNNKKDDDKDAQSIIKISKYLSLLLILF